MGKIDLAGTTALEAEAVELLEKRVDQLIRAYQEIRAERDALRQGLEEKDRRLEALEGMAHEAESGQEALRRLQNERDALTRERSAIARRVEGILNRLEVVGLE